MLGIDIGSRYIKLVALQRRRSRRRRWQLQACVTYRIPQPLTGVPARALQAALQLLPPALQRQLPCVGIALPGSELWIRCIDLPPQLAASELDLAVRMECEQALKPATSPICLDYRPCGERTLVVACRQSMLDQALAVLAAVGIKPALVGVDALIVADTMSPAAASTQLSLYIDAGASGVRLLALRAEEVIYQRSHRLPEPEGSDESAAYLLLLRRAIQQYRLFDMLSRADNIFLYGGAASLPAVHTTVEQAFEAPALRLNPFAHVETARPRGVVLPDQMGVSAFTLAFALAQQEGTCG